MLFDPRFLPASTNNYCVFRTFQAYNKMTVFTIVNVLAPSPNSQSIRPQRLSKTPIRWFVDASMTRLGTDCKEFT